MVNEHNIRRLSIRSGGIYCDCSGRVSVNIHRTFFYCDQCTKCYTLEEVDEAKRRAKVRGDY